MAGDSGSPFTITVGSSGRVVKRKSGRSDRRRSGSGESGLVLGSKRTIKNRLETKGNDSLDGRKHHKSKRHKEESSKASWNASDSNDSCLDKGDLRYKILQKNMSRDSQEINQPTTMDLRDKLSRRTNLSPADSRNRPSEITHDARKNMLDSRDSYNGGRQSIVEHRTYDGEKQITQDPRDAYVHERQSRREFRDVYDDERKIIPQPVNAYNHGRQGMLDPINRCDSEKQCVPEPRECYGCGRQDRLELAPSSRTASNFTAVDMVRNPPSSWAFENPGRRSPDRSLCSSVPTAFFPERNMDESHKVAMISPYGDVNSNLYRRNDIPSPPRAAGPGTYLMHPASHAVSSLPATRPMPLVGQYPQTSGFAHNVPYIVEQPTVIGFLHSLCLEKFAVNFMAEEVDFNALRQMTDADLKELNIPMGPRKKILQALAPQLRRQ